jgi:hypothetical protein
MNLLEYIPSCLVLALVSVLITKRSFTTVPFFFAYVVFALGADLARFLARNDAHAYFATYWLTEAVYAALGILVMYEVLRAVFANLPHPWWAHVIFPIILLTSVGLSLARTQGATARFGSGLGFYIVAGEEAVRIAQVFVFAGAATVVAILGLRWRQYFFGIAAGFGLYATVMLVATTRLADSGRKFVSLWSLTSIATYSIAVSIWIWFFTKPVKTAESKSTTPSPLLQ